MRGLGSGNAAATLAALFPLPLPIPFPPLLPRALLFLPFLTGSGSGNGDEDGERLTINLMMIFFLAGAGAGTTGGGGSMKAKHGGFIPVNALYISTCLSKRRCMSLTCGIPTRRACGLVAAGKTRSMVAYAWASVMGRLESALAAATAAAMAVRSALRIGILDV